MRALASRRRVTLLCASRELVHNNARTPQAFLATSVKPAVHVAKNLGLAVSALADNNGSTRSCLAISASGPQEAPGPNYQSLRDQEGLSRALGLPGLG